MECLTLLQIANLILAGVLCAGLAANTGLLTGRCAADNMDLTLADSPAENDAVLLNTSDYQRTTAEEHHSQMDHGQR